MAQYKITTDICIGFSHHGSENAMAEGTIELTDAEVQTLVELIRKGHSARVEELDVEHKYPQLYEKLHDAYRELNYRAIELYWLWNGVLNGIYEYDTEEAIAYCQEHFGYRYEEPEVPLDENGHLDFSRYKFVDRYTHFRRWLESDFRKFDDETVKDFFYNHMGAYVDMEDEGYDLELHIPEEIIKLAKEGPEDMAPGQSASVWTDPQGGVYSADKTVLLRCPNVEWYRVAEGTRKIDADAFHHCPRLEEVEFPYTLEFGYEESMDLYEEDITEDEYEDWLDYACADLDRDKWDEARWEAYEQEWYRRFGGHKFFTPPETGVFFFDRPYAEEDSMNKVTMHDIDEGVEDEYGVVYSKGGQRLLGCKAKFNMVTDYTVRDGVKIICEYSLNRLPWAGIWLPLVVHLPDSVELIDEEQLFEAGYTRHGNDLIFDHESWNKNYADHDPLEDMCDDSAENP